MATFTSPGAAASRALRDVLLERAAQRRQAVLDGILLDDRAQDRARVEMAMQRQAQLDAVAMEDRQRRISTDERDYAAAQARQAVLDARYEAEQQQRELDRADAAGNRYLDQERRVYDAQQAAEAEAAENQRQRDHAMRIVTRQMAGSAPAAEAPAHDAAAVTINALDELSARINVQAGLTARAGGVWASTMARANYDDDVAEYEATLNGAIPMVARRMGHTGVLTQADVDSVKSMFPRVGDSQALRDRKIARIRQIMNQPSTMPASPASPASPTPTTQQNRPAVFGEMRSINGVRARWDGNGWVRVE